MTMISGLSQLNSRELVRSLDFHDAVCQVTEGRINRRLRD